MASWGAPGAGGFMHKVGPAQDPDEIPIEALVLLFYAVVILLNVCFLIAGCFFTCYYFNAWIKPTADKWARRETIVPQELRSGDWSFGLFDCFTDCDTCLCALCCPLCLMSDTWYRAGWSQGMLGLHEPKRAFYGGCLAIFCLTQFCGSCVACAFAALRGGLNEHPGGFGGAVPLSTRFGIRTNFLKSCCAWLCCQTCAMTQEHRQIMKLVNHPQAVASPPQQMVGVPTQVMMGNPGFQATAPLMHAPFVHGQVVQGVILQPGMPAQPGQSFGAASMVNMIPPGAGAA